MRALPGCYAARPAFLHARLCQMHDKPGIRMMVAEDEALSRVCAAGTVVVEPKFIHEAGCAGHLEDLIVDRSLRGKGVGRAIVGHLLAFARQRGCYKVIVDCAEDNVGAWCAVCGGRWGRVEVGGDQVQSVRTREVECR